MKKVKIYSTPTCMYCKMAKDFFDDKGVEYTDVDLSVDVAARDEVVKKTNQMSVPVIEIREEGKDPEYVIGFDQALLSEKLGIK
ncbi:MAG: NrdH-redoxin [Parcubacteria group bacterium CG10_big_fil_rev_8_21_14_0_10_38_31]|nr:MAG: NrdH-redoxin [Parcubacteria group bacterium CG10_big_fil_rev_8_21_14_0_10_38_31]